MSTDHHSEQPAAVPPIVADAHHAHDYALAALDDAMANSLVAVTWSSAHLAAVERVLHPQAARLLSGGRERVRAQTLVDSRLQRALWRLDRSLTGDVHMRGIRRDPLEDAVRVALREHAEGEHDLLTDLNVELDDDQRQDISRRLAVAMMRGPTRPHPTRPLGGRTRMAFWFGGVVDRARDGMDGRSVPTPRRPVSPLPMTRWGAYMVGPNRGWPPQT